MAWVLKKHGLAINTSSAQDITGTDLLVAVTDSGASWDTPTPSDNVGNTYTALTEWTVDEQNRLWYVSNPTISASYQLTVSNPNGLGTSGAYQAWSGSLTSGSPFDAQSGAAADPGGVGSTTLQAAAAVGVSGELVVAGASGYIVSSFSPDVGTVSDSSAAVAGTRGGIAMAYVAPASGSVNPTWTFTGSGINKIAISLASFKASGGGATGKLFTPSNMDGIGSGGPFFSDRLAA